MNTIFFFIKLNRFFELIRLQLKIKLKFETLSLFFPPPLKSIKILILKVIKQEQNLLLNWFTGKRKN